jgi:hypothetical protein
LNTNIAKITQIKRKVRSRVQPKSSNESAARVLVPFEGPRDISDFGHRMAVASNLGVTGTVMSPRQSLSTEAPTTLFGSATANQLIDSAEHIEVVVSVSAELQ